MKTNYKFTIRYDGTRYYGWEHQPDRETIQGKLETILQRLCGAPVDLIGAGRTDAGVHAKAMVANAVLDTALSPEEICAYLNRYLPEDISVLEVKAASERFHARYKAVGKTYQYTCCVGGKKPVFDRRYVTRVEDKLDLDKMRRAADTLVGEHDFASFCSNPRMKKSTVRTVDQIDITQKGHYLYLTFHGDGFLQNMIRIIVGTLLEVGRGKIRPEQMQAILLSKDRTKAGPTAPPQGLCLVQVDY